LDAIKSLGFRYATKSGLTISIDDVVTTSEKAAILEKYEEQAAKVETQLPPRRHRRRRAPSAGDRDLDQREQGGR
jgi:DNA-directed RNA polymerase beta' subunit